MSFQSTRRSEWQTMFRCRDRSRVLPIGSGCYIGAMRSSGVAILFVLFWACCGCLSVGCGGARSVSDGSQVGSAADPVGEHYEAARAELAELGAHGIAVRGSATFQDAVWDLRAQIEAAAGRAAHVVAMAGEIAARGGARWHASAWLLRADVHGWLAAQIETAEFELPASVEQQIAALDSNAQSPGATATGRDREAPAEGDRTGSEGVAQVMILGAVSPETAGALVGDASLAELPRITEPNPAEPSPSRSPQLHGSMAEQVRTEILARLREILASKVQPVRCLERHSLATALQAPAPNPALGTDLDEAAIRARLAALRPLNCHVAAPPR